jgi:glycosyltransferase involved in cell wall biosynthesis
VEFVRPEAGPLGQGPREFLHHRLRFNMALPSLLERRGPWDLIVGFDVDGVFLPNQEACPLVVSLKGVAADEARFETGAHRALLHTLARFEARNVARAHRVVVPSRYSAQVAAKHYRIPSARLTVVPEGLKLGPWRAIREERARTQSPSPTLLSVARQYPRKDTATLIRAMARLEGQWPQLHLRVLGGGPELSRLRRLVQELGLEPRVTLEGPVPDATIREAFREAQIFVLPSKQEGFGIVFLEAMAAGLPVIAARAGATPEVVRDGETGILVPPGDPDALAQAIQHLLETPNKRRAMARAGIQRSAQYEPSRVARLFLQRIHAPVPHAPEQDPA